MLDSRKMLRQHATILLMAMVGIAVNAEVPKTDLNTLLQVQSQVQKLFPQAKAALVAIQTGGGTASGVIISPSGLLLTAAHVVDKPGREIRVVLQDGTVTMAKSLGVDQATDAALAQLKDLAKPWPSVNLSRDLGKAQPGEWCFALGHPGGFDKARGPVLRVGKIVKQTANNLHSDCVLMGGDSGGPLFNMDGEVIGIHSQIWEERDQNVHVSMAPFLRSWDAMQASQVIRVWGIGAGGYLGVATRMTDQVELEVADVIEGSPALRAGVLAGDVILELNGDAMTDQHQFTAAVKAKAAGDVVNLKLRRAGKERQVVVTLTQKPKGESTE
jgi:serine protease Do